MNNSIWMNKKAKYIAIVVFLLILSVSGFLLMRNKEEMFSRNAEEKSNIESNSDISYLLNTYPIEDVPLYKVTKVSSSKLYINWDPKNISTFDDKEFIYYNVVLYTEASQQEFLDYYKDLFEEEIFDEYPIPDMVKGNIGKYRVTAAHYDYDNTAYIQVYLPENEFTKDNMYFDTYPDLFKGDTLFVEHENSYGLLNQVGGQVEYTRYFTVLDSGDQNDDGKDDVDEFAGLIAKYKGLYSGKEEYEFDEKNGRITWIEDGYDVVASFTRDHGRVYLNIRGAIEDLKR